MIVTLILLLLLRYYHYYAVIFFIIIIIIVIDIIIIVIIFIILIVIIIDILLSSLCYHYCYVMYMISVFPYFSFFLFLFPPVFSRLFPSSLRSTAQFGHQDSSSSNTFDGPLLMDTSASSSRRPLHRGGEQGGVATREMG